MKSLLSQYCRNGVHVNRELCFVFIIREGLINTILAFIRLGEPEPCPGSSPPKQALACLIRGRYIPVPQEPLINQRFFNTSLVKFFLVLPIRILRKV